MIDIPKDLRMLVVSTSGVRDLYMGYPAAELITQSDEVGIDALVVELVSTLRSRGHDDQGLWDGPGTAGIPVVSGATALDPHGVLADTAAATSALVHLRAGRPAEDIVSPDGQRGIAALVRHLVGKIRSAGVDDEGWLDCDVTWDIRVADPIVAGWSR